MKTLRICLPTVLLLFLGASSLTWADEKPAFSGFLKDYQGFKEDKHNDGALLYMKPGIDLSYLKNYDKLMIDPILVYYSPKSEFTGIYPDELKAMTDYFRKALIDALEPEYPVVSKPGPGVLRLRIAITGIERKKPGLSKNPLAYLPVTLVFKGAQKATQAAKGETVSVIRASLEAEVLDGVSDERLFAVVDSELSDKVTAEEGDKSWEHVTSVLDHWAERLRKRMDEEHGKEAD